MSKHTPGPWQTVPLLSGSENDKGFRVWSRADGIDPNGHGYVWIADVSPVIDNDRGDASEEGKANARLIAAAPDLLEALKAARAFAGSMNEDEPFFGEKYGYEALKSWMAAVIAKAEGA